MSTRALTILASWSPGEVRVATISAGKLIDYALWRPGSPDGVGDVLKGRVTALVPAMAGAFVALTGTAADAGEGFLPDSEGAKGLTVGAIVTVRVTRAALGGKGPRLSAQLEAEITDACLPRRGIDPLRERAARYPEARIVVDDAALMASLRADLADRVTLAPLAFDDAIETEVETLAAPVVTLASGVRLSVFPTPALVAIDVDGGGALGGRDTPARRHLALNEAVVPEIARQIRLRDLSGAILVDLAGLRPRQRTALAPALAASLADDPARPRFLGFTALGLAEIVRPRIRAPLHEALSGPLAAGLAALRTIARASRVEPGRALGLRASPEVVTALRADAVALPDLARITGRALNLLSDPSLPADSWSVEAAHG